MREACGLTQEQLAHAVHMTPSAIGKLERGHRRLRSDQLPVFAKALNLADPTELLPGGATLSQRERAMLDLFKRLDPAEQEKALRVLHALAQPAEAKRSAT